MSRRPANLPHDMMTTAELKQLRHSLMLLSPHIVREKYLHSLDRCRFMELATPRMMQELVALWRVLWKWRK